LTCFCSIIRRTDAFILHLRVRVVVTLHCIVDMDTGVDPEHRVQDRTLGMEVRRRTPWRAPAEEHGADEGNGRMGWCGRPEEGVWAVGGHPADIYSVWSTRPEPGKGGLAPAPGGHRDDTEVHLKGQDPSWHRGRGNRTATRVHKTMCIKQAQER